MESGTAEAITQQSFCRHEKETNLCVDVEAGQSRRRIQRRGEELKHAREHPSVGVGLLWIGDWCHGTCTGAGTRRGTGQGRER